MISEPIQKSIPGIPEQIFESLNFHLLLEIKMIIGVLKEIREENGSP